MKLQSKLLLSFLPVVLLIGVAVAILTRNMLHRVVVEEVGRTGMAKAEEMAAGLSVDFPQLGESELLRHLYSLQSDTSAVYAMALDGKGKVLAHTNVVETGKVYGDAATLAALQLQEPGAAESFVQNDMVLEVTVPVWASEDEPLFAGPGRTRLGTLRLGLPLGRARRTEQRIASRILSAFLGSTAVVALLLVVFVRRLLQPVRHLAEATAALARGARDVQVPVRSRDELADLARAFNSMSQEIRIAQAEAVRLAAEAATLQVERAKAAELEQAYHRLDLAHRELKDTQAQLVQAGKLAGLGEIAAGIAHELNQPLTAVLGFAQRLRTLVAQQFPDRVAEADFILTASRRMAQIVNNVRSFARQGDFVPLPTTSWGPVRDALMLLSEQLRLHSIEVHESFSPDLPPVLADGTLMQQVFLNLLTNARDALEALPEGQPRNLALEARAEGRWLVYTIRDNGPGVPEANVARIFDPFFTTKEVGKGMGLGLALTYGIVKKHGGEITYDPAPGGGAVFTVRVPAAEAGEGAEA